MIEVPWYAGLVVLLQLVGLLCALTFLAQHRPRQWRRLAAWDASGWVALAALLYGRSLFLLIVRWPGSPPDGWLDAGGSLLLLLIADVLLINRVLTFRAFVEHDRDRQHERLHD